MVIFFTSIFVWIVVAEKLGQWELAEDHRSVGGITVFREISGISTMDVQKNALSAVVASSSLLREQGGLALGGGDHRRDHSLSF